MATSVSFINMKGGVGKTTLAMQTALSAAAKNLRVLAVDLDPQSNLSQSLMGGGAYVTHVDEDRPTVVQVFEEYVPPSRRDTSPRRLDIKDVVLPRCGRNWGRDRLDLIPSRLELSRTLKNPAQKERRLAKALAQVADDYDLIVIDCAPTESILTDAAYFASRYVVVPVKPEFLATIGLPLLAKSMDDFRSENEDHTLEMAGLVFVHSEYQEGPEARTAVEDVTRNAGRYRWPIFVPTIPYSKSFPRAARESARLAHTSNVQYRTEAAFAAFFGEFLQRVGLEAAAHA